MQDLLERQTAKYAHLLLPGASFLEKDGTFTNLERRIQRIRKVAEPPNGILPDWQVVCEVSARMGYPMRYRPPSEIMDEMATLSPMLAGVSYERLNDPNGLQWPVPGPAHAGTPLMHRETFTRGKGRFMPVDYLPPGEQPTDAYPFVLVTGRILEHYNCGAQTRRTEIIELVDGDALEMHPDDVSRLKRDLRHCSSGARHHDDPVRRAEPRRARGDARIDFDTEQTEFRHEILLGVGH